ncbi:MAG: SulA-like leucine-rich domain-containing protein [Psychromonas sp.]|nr:SulA-like leucine-rich domain-containing protein [Psychromonas sp.]
MLRNYMPAVQQQTGETIKSINVLPYLSISYDLNNYYSLLTHIAQDSDPRWILFIAPPGRPNFAFLQQAGIHKSRIITLPQNKIDDHTKLLKAALKSRNYATIITWVNDCDKTLQNELNDLAALSASNCFIYCTQ